MATIVERDKPWYEARLPMLDDRIHKRLGQLSTFLGNADWLDGAFSAGDLMMVTVLRRLNGSGLLEEHPNVAGGATWVSLHHGGGVGMGYSQHSGIVIVCDGSEEADKRIARVLWNDPATGVMRHADAGYEIAKQCAKEQGLKLPMNV